MKMSRRRFLSFLGKLFGAGLADVLFGFDRQAQGASLLPHKPLNYWEYLPMDYFRQVVGRDAAAERAVLWQSGYLQGGARLEYRRRGENVARWADVSYEYSDEAGGLYTYTARLTNLAPGEEYECRAVAAGAAGDWQRLRPVGGGEFVMLVFCDSQCVDYGVWGKVADFAAKRHKNAAAFTVIGDLVDNGYSDYQWRQWFGAAKNLLGGLVFAPVMGNHECYDQQWLAAWPWGYLRRFAVPKNDNVDFAGFYYSFDMGAAHFMVLNTQFTEIDGIKSNLLTEQLDWLKRDAKSHDRPWQIVLMHKDIMTYGTGKYDPGRGGFNQDGGAFMAAFDKLGVDLVLTGHEHTYRNRGHIYQGKAAATGPYYVMGGLSGDQRYPGLWQSPFDRVIAPQPEIDNYLCLKVTENAIELVCYNIDGSVIDKVSLNK